MRFFCCSLFVEDSNIHARQGSLGFACVCVMCGTDWSQSEPAGILDKGNPYPGHCATGVQNFHKLGVGFEMRYRTHRSSGRVVGSVMLYPYP